MASKRLLFLFLHLFFIPAWAVECPAEPDPRSGDFEIGATYGALFPSGIIGLSQTLPTLGVVVGGAIQKHTLQAQVNFASNPTIQILILELNMRWNFDSPFLRTYFITGVHHLHQHSLTGAASDFTGIGATGGMGLAFALGKQVEVSFGFKGYIENRTTILVSGGFSMIL